MFPIHSQEIWPAKDRCPGRRSSWPFLQSALVSKSFFPSQAFTEVDTVTKSAHQRDGSQQKLRERKLQLTEAVTNVQCNSEAR